MRGEKLIKGTKVILDVMLYSGIIVFLTLPLTLKFAAEHYSSAIREHYYPMLFVLGGSAILGLVIIFRLRRMMQTVVRKNCFVHENVKSLKIMSFVSIVISLVYATKVFFLPTPATFVIILTFFIAGLFSGVLSFVFAEAVRFKEENELTI